MKTHVNWKEAELPERTETYEPVPHSTLITIIEAKLEASGYKVGSNYVEQNHEGTQIVGHMGVVRDDAIDFHQQFCYINSYDKKKAITFASGAEVFICSNGMIVSEFVTMRKHTSMVWRDINGKVDEAIGQLNNNWIKTVADVELMKSVELTRTQSSEILGRLFIDEGIISSTEINEAVRQLKKPKFSEFADLTMWSLYNHCTYAMRESKPYRKTKALKDLHDFSVEYSNDFITVNG